MAIELHHADEIDERLRSLEDRVLAERLALDNPALFADGPPQTEREVLAWATRRFGTIVIAVTAAVSIAAGYVLGPLVTKHERPAAAPAVHAAAAPAVRAAAAQPHRAAQRHAAKPVAHAVAPATPRRTYAAAIAHRAAVVHPVTHPRAVPAPNREQIALRRKVRAQEAEIARLRRLAAANAAAARHANASATAHRYAPRTEPAPRTAPRTDTAVATSTGTATATTTATDVGVSQQPADVGTTTSTGGVKTPPTQPGGVWSERPPIPLGTYGNGPQPVLVDPCTPRGGRTGSVLNSIIRSAAGHIRI